MHPKIIDIKTFNHWYSNIAIVNMHEGTKWYHDLRVTFLPESEPWMAQVEILTSKSKLYMDKHGIYAFLWILS